MGAFLAQHPNLKFITSRNCELEEYFKKKKIMYVLAPELDWPEYIFVTQYYRNAVTSRTGHLINYNLALYALSIKKHYMLSMFVLVSLVVCGPRIYM